MARPKKKITSGGNFPTPGQRKPNTIVLTAPKRFGVDIADYINSMRAAENVDFTQRTKLYDLYTDVLTDAHLTSVLNKRHLAIKSSPIQFIRNGKPDEAINKQLASPWFLKLLSDILDAQFWGFSLFQFQRMGEWISADMIPRKHVDPVKQLILHRQNDIHGTSWKDFPDMLFVGDKRELGLLAKAAAWVIYKRNTTGDWAQFSEVFGSPIQEYVYDVDDEEARQRALADSQQQGSLGVVVHGKDSELRLIETANKSGTVDVFKELKDTANAELSKLFLGNTLTTESSKNGTQSLGTVHEHVEDEIADADRLYICNILNYEMSDIFASMGINTADGEFIYVNPELIDKSKHIDILVKLKTNFNLPISDEYLYETFGIEKPKDYNNIIKQRKELAPPTPAEPKQEPKQEPPAEPKQEPKEDTEAKAINNFFARLKDFFVQAPKGDGAEVLKW